MISPPPPMGSDWKTWGERLVSYITTNTDKLRHLTSGESAAEDGVSNNSGLEEWRLGKG